MRHWIVFLACWTTAVALDANIEDIGDAQQLHQSNYRRRLNGKLGGKSGKSSRSDGKSGKGKSGKGSADDDDSPTFAPTVTLMPTPPSEIEIGKGGKDGKRSGKSGKGASKSAGTQSPTALPTGTPTISPTNAPTVSNQPSISSPPSLEPSEAPSTSAPTEVPTVSTMQAMGNANFVTEVDMENVAGKYRAAFTKAAARWSEVITGDLEDFEPDASIRSQSQCPYLPSMIDDVFICATVDSIDGEGGILGTSGPEFVRLGEKLIPTIGRMRFDEMDVINLMADNSFEGVIMHEMGHVYGIGTLWDLNGLLAEDWTYRKDLAASQQYAKLSGCAGIAMPVEEDDCDYTNWDEYCLQGELMTSVTNGELALSALTVAALEDLGYEVDYAAADPFSAASLDPACRCEAPASITAASLESLEKPKKRRKNGKKKKKHSERQLTTTSSGSSVVHSSNVRKVHGAGRRRLSEAGLDAARAYGIWYLKDAALKARTVLTDPLDKYSFVGDKLVSVLYREEGHIYAVDVTETDL